MVEHDPAALLAYLRCADQHPDRHDQGGVGTCEACRSWGKHAASAVVPAVREATLLEAAETFRQAERDGYLFLNGSTERVPWQAVAARIGDLAEQQPRGLSGGDRG